MVTYKTFILSWQSARKPWLVNIALFCKFPGSVLNYFFNPLHLIRGCVFLHQSLAPSPKSSSNVILLRLLHWPHLCSVMVAIVTIYACKCVRCCAQNAMYVMPCPVFLTLATWWCTVPAKSKSRGGVSRWWVLKARCRDIWALMDSLGSPSTLLRKVEPVFL